jgi:amino acid transporter
MTSGEIAALVTVISTLLSFVGLTGIDQNTISQAVIGIISFIGIISAVWTYIAHHNAVAANQANTPPPASS